MGMLLVLRACQLRAERAWYDQLSHRLQPIAAVRLWPRAAIMPRGFADSAAWSACCAIHEPRGPRMGQWRKQLRAARALQARSGLSVPLRPSARQIRAC